jgi:hypothetical protein
MSAAFAGVGYQEPWADAESLLSTMPLPLQERLRVMSHRPALRREKPEACTAYFHAKSSREQSAQWFEQLAMELLDLGVLPSTVEARDKVLVVDWGCGTGNLLSGLASAAGLVRDRVEYLGVDHDRTRIALARAVTADLGGLAPKHAFDFGAPGDIFSVSSAVRPQHRTGETIVHVFGNSWREGKRSGVAREAEDLLASGLATFDRVRRFTDRHGSGSVRTVLVHVLTTASNHGFPPREAAVVMRRMMQNVEEEHEQRVHLPCPHPKGSWTTACPRPSYEDTRSPPHRQVDCPGAVTDLAEFCTASQTLKQRTRLRDFVLVHTLDTTNPEASYGTRQVHVEGASTCLRCWC